MCDAEDELHFVRFAWCELTGLVPEHQDVDETVLRCHGLVCIDAKSIYDCLVNRTHPQSLLEKRTALELLSYVRNTRRNQTTTRWIHGEANPADGLTKINAEEALQAFLEKGSWTLVYDPEQRSAKKRKAQGLRPLASPTIATVDFGEAATAFLELHWPDHRGDSEDDEPWMATYPCNL